MKRQTNLSETLMREFCPPLDSSLVAALLVEIQVDTDGYSATPTQAQIHQLRTTLRELAAQADETQLCELSHSRVTSPTEGSGSSIPDFYPTHTDTSGSLTSACSVSSYDSADSQLGFLQAALPDIPLERLLDALAQAERESDDPDLWNVISNILGDDAIRELEERGLEQLDEDDAIFSDGNAWETVRSRAGRRPAASGIKIPGNKSKPKPQKIPLLDIRQQHRVQSFVSPRTPNALATDSWTRVMSVAEQLSRLLRPYSATYFQSYFHSPQYSTPYEALCSALEAMPQAKSELATEDVAVYSNLLDIMTPEYEDMLDSETQPNLCADLQLAISVTRGHSDDALDLVRLLRDLASDSKSGRMEMGVYHSPVRTSSICPPSASPAKPSGNIAHLPTGPPSPPPPPNKSKPPLPEDQNRQKFTATKARSPRDINTAKSDAVSDIAECYKRRKANLQRRDELYREASQMWRRRNSKSQGGQVAMFLAERAREFQKMAKREALDAARAKVHAKRCASLEKDTIDLHGTTAAEAIAIVREELEHTMYSSTRPLKIITGRGSHSVNQKSILKPSIQKALREDGWSVSVWDGGLTIRGKKASS